MSIFYMCSLKYCGNSIELWCLRNFQQYFSYIVVVSFIGGGNRRTRKKTTDLSRVTDKLYYMIMYRVHFAMNGVRTHNFNGNRY